MYSMFVGNPYEIMNTGEAICTTTNGETRKNGYAVMGKGNAQLVRDTFKLDKLLGEYLLKYGNRAFYLGAHSYKGKDIIIASFPTKQFWKDKSNLDLIEKSVEQIKKIADKYNLKKIYIPVPGCSNGQLKWSQVKERLCTLDERFIIYSLDRNDFSK
jgi:hypothetical protein